MEDQCRRQSPNEILECVGADLLFRIRASWLGLFDAEYAGMGSFATVYMGTRCNIEMSRMSVLHEDLWTFKFLSSKHAVLPNGFCVQIAIHLVEPYDGRIEINTVVRCPKITSTPRGCVSLREALFRFR